MSIIITAFLAIIAASAYAQSVPVTRLDRAIRAVCPLIIGVSPNGATWKVYPGSQQGCAQSTINIFDASDPSHEQAELDAQVKGQLDSERLTSAVVWVILKQMFPADTDAQLKTKYGVARTRIIGVYQTQPWKQ